MNAFAQIAALPYGTRFMLAARWRMMSFPVVDAAALYQYRISSEAAVSPRQRVFDKTEMKPFTGRAEASNRKGEGDQVSLVLALC